MTDSILTSIKKMLGITEECTSFDTDLVLHINSVFMNLKQLGVGPSSGFMIEDDSATWEDYIPTSEDQNKITLVSAVKSYIHLKVKLLFDPPVGAAVMESFKQQIAELEWRLNVEAESK